MWQFEAENLSSDPKTKVSFSSHQEAYGSTQFQPPNTTPIVWSTAPTNSYLCLRNCAQVASYMSSHQKKSQTVIPKSKREVQRKKVIQQLHKYLLQTSHPLMSLSYGQGNVRMTLSRLHLPRLVCAGEGGSSCTLPWKHLTTHFYRAFYHFLVFKAIKKKG